VHYNVTGMIETNRDLIPDPILQIMDNCKCRFLAELFPLVSERCQESKMSRPITVGSQVKHQPNPNPNPNTWMSSRFI
jgi:myosin heavy subunit